MTYGQQLIQKGRHEGMQQGLQQGIEQNQQAIAKKMLLKGRPIQEIADLTDLPLSKIKLVKQSLLH